LPLVTVCVPAYKSAAFLPQTLSSITEQTFSDFHVLVAIEPVEAEETLEACRDFKDDDRFEFFVNDRTYGWAGNVQNLFSRVETPFFTALPHDDLWHPRYLEALTARIAPRPDVSCVFADAFVFLPPSGVRSYDLPDADLAQRLLAFFLHGAEGHAWRGLTRTEVLRSGFQDNEFDGFAVETEWSAHLVMSGRVLPHKEPLYLKRQRDTADEDSVSVGWRFRMEPDRMRAALAHNRSKMLAIADTAPVTSSQREELKMAAQSAMLGRFIVFGRDQLDFESSDFDLAGELTVVHSGESAFRRAVRARVELTLSRYWMVRGRVDEGFLHARTAVEAAPDYADAAVQMARLHLRQNEPAEALRFASHAFALEPMAPGLAELQVECAKRLAKQHAFE
jgi:Glycosyl transferase family 2